MMRPSSSLMFVMMLLLGVRGQVSRDVKSRWLSLVEPRCGILHPLKGATRYSASSILEPPARAGSTTNVADKVGS